MHISIKMRKNFEEIVGIPEGVDFEIEGNVVKIKGPKGSISKKLNKYKIEIVKQGGKIIIKSDNATKTEKKMIYTIIAHLKNMIQGVTKPFEYTLKICYNHFPINVDIKGRDVIVKNFLGEKVPRKIKLPEGAEAKVDKEIITVKSIDKEVAGQAAANLEKVTKVRNRDRRVFQDGIFITNKAGKDL